ncbi:MAG: hypothetical protein E6H67_17915 [Betaproteobacteria bacterium]|nr:MAG: hypothetical protein E6H67_17915 [Betaproteobacteria bacterium]
MNTFKRKSLYAALAGVGALGVTGAAQAVNVNPDGLGQALIYPYYTTQGTGTLGSVAPYNSLLSVVNSTNSGKVVKVRFLEGKFSHEVLDFNLWLSPKDVWTAAIVPLGAGAGIVTADLSCTTPTVSRNAAAPTPFVNVLLVAPDPAGAGLDRTKEGYVEIIEMGNLTGGTLTAITHVQPSPPGRPPAENAAGDCPTLPVGATAPTDLVPGNGGLFGGISLINPLAGGDASEDAVALASFSATTLWAPAGSIQPDLSQVNPKLSVVFNNTEVVTTDWSASSNTADAVSAILMHDNIFNEFVLDAGTASGTDWVVTFPTKHFYYNAQYNVTKLFESNFRATGACDDVGITIWNREEQTVQQQTTFSPPPPQGVDSLCWEANVITFNNTNVLLSANNRNIATGFPNGWVTLNFFPGPSTIIPPVHQLIGGATIRQNTGTGALTQQVAATYNGLPVVGFAAQSFNNGTLVGTSGGFILAHYVGTFIHKYTRLIQ